MLVMPPSGSSLSAAEFGLTRSQRVISWRAGRARRFELNDVVYNITDGRVMRAPPSSGMTFWMSAVFAGMQSPALSVRPRFRHVELTLNPRPDAAGSTDGRLVSMARDLPLDSWRMTSKQINTVRDEALHHVSR